MQYISQHQPAAHVANKKPSHSHEIKTQNLPKTKINKPKSHRGGQSKKSVAKNQPKKKSGARQSGPRKELLDELKGQHQLGPFLFILCDILRPFINSTIHLNLFR